MRSSSHGFHSPLRWFVATGCLLAISIPAAAQAPKPRTTLGDGTKWLKVPDSLACSPDGRSVAVAAAGRVYTYDVAKRALVAEWTPYQTESTPQLAVAFSPDGKALATGGFVETAGRGNVAPVIWDAATGKQVREFDGRAFCRSLAFDARGKYLATTGLNMQAVLWNAETGKRVVDLGAANNPASLVAMSPDGNTMASMSFRGVSIWRPEAAEGSRLQLLIKSTGKDTMTPAVPGRGRAPKNAPSVDSKLTLRRVAFSPNGKLVACGGTERNLNQVELWDLEAKRAVKLFVETEGTEETGSLDFLCFSPSGHMVLAGSSNKIICWHVETGMQAFVLREKSRLVDIGKGRKVQFTPFALTAMSGDGRVLATVSGSTAIRVWDMPAAFSEPKP
jgi:WD40 repeat protein